MPRIDWVGFDGDDTLWKSEDYYRAAEAAFEQIIGHYIDLADRRTQQHLLAVERRNLRVFGYGVKGMTLSMIEAAIELTGQRISTRHIQDILAIGRATLDHPVDLLDGIRPAVEAIAARHRIVLITKGDLFHQEAKIVQSGLSDLFHRIEVVSEKDTPTYQRVLDELDVAPERFAMIGNSLRSDIAPVVGLGGWGIHMPYHVTWAHEAEHDLAENTPRLLQVQDARELPGALARIESGLEAP
ncbi:MULTISPECIES: HAD family hydrolase [Pseudoxanthomonas]|jgi:putative hydrolase of the HAD superfamily|uniref:HAD family hydrolase n=1 Tax=Pseudoxanthomonas winnipegensis TaxID=2480810 RepID=A0A4Q8LD80_9GAMM|nr:MULTISPECIES: HAD family hydrolase [Pseudoxanthomonas]PZP61578.1 MAG: haloacid dehalogenase [Pseudoxanthomonas spadix]TAA26520.1 HAD family hydrolase [Pseudoxanthomonas winnipegensis]TMN24139.1 HAD family hydrolase [Pseudoxanthomonas sp. X-1]UAY75104.1 HAD family hydrolase [Pseudoxanthomonas sp. X-1]